MTIPEQTNFIGKLKEDDDAAMFLLLKSSTKLFQIFFSMTSIIISV